MLTTLQNHFYIFLTVLLSFYSQLIIKWKVTAYGDPGVTLSSKTEFVIRLLLNPWVITALIATFMSGVAWMFALSKFPLSYAYPFISLLYPMMLLAGAFIFNETITMTEIIGICTIILGLYILSR